MHLLPEPQPRQRRYSARRQARLDGETYAKLEELTKAFHRERGSILRYVIQWEISHSAAWTIDQSIHTTVNLVPLLVEPALIQQVENAAEAHGVTVAAWLRHAMRQVRLEDFPPSWRAGETAARSHDPGSFHRKFGLRLDEGTARKLEALTETFDRSAAEIIRQLITQATPEVFPQDWQLAVKECRPREARRDP
jgi:predicted transcriptional regulator